ncbi:DNA-directed DNA/RNA polymerase mu-like isoform X2 [Ascaphus truei]
MSLVPLKRRRRSEPVPGGTTSPAGTFPGVCVFLVERRMGRARRAFLTALAQGKGFSVTPEYSDAVTHVVSEQNSGSEVLMWIERQSSRPVEHGGAQGGPQFLDITWFTESMSVGRPVGVEPRHCLGVEEFPAACNKAPETLPYACQRRTPLHHHNQEITDALHVLAKAASFEGSEVRSLGFIRAASVLKSLPFRLRSAEEARGLPWCGGHCRTVIQEILEDEACREVEMVKISDQYRSMELLTGIFGVGVRTAERWYREGVRSLRDLQSIERKLTAEQRAGLRHYTDLQQPVTREEAVRAELLVKDALQRFLPEVQVTMTGGFRRGKQQGHDVDFLITHPDEGALTGLLKKAVDWLESKEPTSALLGGCPMNPPPFHYMGMLLYHQIKERSHGRRTASITMDGHETCFSIVALPNGDTERTGLDALSPEPVSPHGAGPEALASWRAVRVDLVVAAYSEYSYALLGWTGSKHFERELRRFSSHKKKMSLSSHRLYDTEQCCSLPATCEEEIFAHLGLQYLTPSDRNA